MNCLICNGSTTHTAHIPFDRSCEAPSDTGGLIEYVSCVECGFCFAPDLCAKSPAWFAEHIYNADYRTYDPDYNGERSERAAKNLIYWFSFARKRIHHLDYGSGEGKLTEHLLKAGFDSTAYDPFTHDVRPEGQFNLITAFEVIEHAPDPQKLMREMAALLSPVGLLVVSTNPSDGEDIANWWYAAPRNGHISLFSVESLRRLASSNGLSAWIDPNFGHQFYRQAPDWAVN